MQNRRLQGRVALVTGASRGIGAAVAKAYAAEGAHVILLARTRSDLASVEDEIKTAGGAATVYPFDLLKYAEIGKLGVSIAEKFRRLDILVGNAAILGSLSPVAMSDPGVWEQTFVLNTLANYHLIRTLDPFLRGSDAGLAIFVTSGAASSSIPFWGAYAASKSALETMVKTYAAEVAYSPLRVMLVDPGAVRTDMRAQAFPGEDPQTLPHPDTVAQKFVEYALAGKPQKATKTA